MAGVNDIMAYGFGGWSTVNQIPTLGFGNLMCTLGAVQVTGLPATVESRDELTTGTIVVQGFRVNFPLPGAVGVGSIVVQPFNVFFSATTDGNTWTPTASGRTWYPTKNPRTWKV